MKRLIYCCIFGLLISCSGTQKQSTQTITVFAAASLTDAVTELAKDFELANGIEVRLNLAASGTLARQIDQGADADVYLSANKSWMDFLVDKGKSKDTAVFAKNELVLISAINDDIRFQQVDSLLVKSKGKIAIGDPGYVPAGKYAMQVFDFLKLDLEDKLLQTQNVRSSLMMVELGEAKLGVVYKTDAIQSKKVRVVYTFPEMTHEPVQYYKVLVSDEEMAKQFYDYLYSPQAKELLTKYSFITD